MRIKELSERLTCRLHGISPGDAYFAISVAALAAILHCCGVVAERYRVLHSHYMEVHMSSTIPILLLVIGIALFLNLIGLWSRKAVGLLVSMLSLTAVGVGYLLWYIYSEQALNALATKSFPEPPPAAIPSHPYNLVGAAWWNITVLALAALLFCWELKSFITILLPFNKNNQ